MNLLFKNTTKYTKELYLSFLTFHNQKFSYKYHFFSFLVTILFLIGIIMQLSYSLFIPAITLIIFLIFFIIYRYFFPSSKISKELKNKESNHSIEITFCFYDNHFEIFNKDSGVSIEYKNIYKVYELSDSFYIYANKQYAWLVNKNSFSIGNYLDFSEFLRKKCWRKYKEAQV